MSSLEQIQNYWSNLNQTWHKASLGNQKFKCVQTKVRVLFKWGNNKKRWKIADVFKHFLQNHWANFTLNLVPTNKQATFNKSLYTNITG